MTKLHALNQLGQSMWYDNIRRALLDHGEMKALIDAGVTGVTSNPTIFDKAITGSSDYDTELHQLAVSDLPTDAIYETLAISDIQRVADLLRPVYDRTDGVDGYVSLEVSPLLANDTTRTISEAKRLFAMLDRPNVMIKIPATPAGMPAVTAAIAAGVNVNVTLIFSLAHYEAVAEAYISGLEQLAASGGDLRKVASVASFFVSRVDTKVDKALEAKGASDLLGTIANANAKLAYARFKQIFAGERWKRLAVQGARVQRPLWASTGTKNPNYSDTLYVDNLIGPDTVNTVPPATLSAFREHGSVAATLEAGLKQDKACIARLADLGIDLDAVTEQLQVEGVAAFAESFESLMDGLSSKLEQIRAARRRATASLGAYQAAVDAALNDLREQKIIERIWKHDHMVWKPEPTEITNRLGWLHSPDVMVEAIAEITALVDEVRAAGYTHALLLGMGGSSLAPEVFRMTFGVADGYLDLAVLDSTDPGAVLEYDRQLDLARTLFIVSTKSGGTVETFSFFKYFYDRVADTLGAAEAGKHFVAITDPGSGLVDTAQKYHFRKVFLNDPNIGGRYSALSYFGMVPAALIGVEIAALLANARAMAGDCGNPNAAAAGENTGVWMGAIMGELAVAGRDKLTLLASPPVAAFGGWAEQLIAESLGKEGVGVLPVADEPLGSVDVYGPDRLFVYLRMEGDDAYDTACEELRAAGYPVVQFNLDSAYDLGGEFLRWEIATAIAGRRLGINPFDQPNVESAKVLARKMVAAYHQEGKLPALAPTLEVDGVTVYTDAAATSLDAALKDFLACHSPGDAESGAGRSYIAIQAYVTPTMETTVALQDLRAALRDRLRLAVTVGYGPRFLHSTGQLHKGDAGNGLFIQVTDDPREDAAIPDEAGVAASSMSFGVLIASQALGDRQALLDNQRNVIGFHLGADVRAGLRRLQACLDNL